MSKAKGLLATVARLLVLSVTLWVLMFNATMAYADNTPCTPGDLTCVGVGVGGDGGDGGGGSTPPSDGGGGKKAPDPCAKYPSGYYEMCVKFQSGGPLGCLGLYDQYYGTMPLAEFNEFVVQNDCPPVAAAADPPPTPAELAEQAAASFHLLLPSGHRSPSENRDIDGFPFTYVNLWTFYWTDPGTWKSLTATASAGGNYATVTATPVSLTFDPGDGSRATSCEGPGRPWQATDANNAPSDSACGYRYSRITGPGYDHPVTSTQTITWQLTWTGSNNTNGTLTERTTSTTGSLNVLQIQTVNR